MSAVEIKPIKPQNRVRTVMKKENGDLRVTLESGRVFSVSKDSELAQAFIIYTMLGGGQ